METALVLSGGGVRGAYEVGVIRGILDVLGRRHVDPPPFRVFSGTSVGAINATYLACHAQRGDLGIDGLCELWRTLSIERHVRFDLWGLVGLGPIRSGGKRVGRSVLNPRALEEMVAHGIDWTMLHDNIRAGRARALLVPALHLESGATWVFTEVSPGFEYHETPDPRRHAVHTQIGPDHLLASSALPIFYPARRIGHDTFLDGGLRFNTPIKSTLRLGVDRLVVISPVGEDAVTIPTDPVKVNLLLILGKVLNTLMLDPVRAELESVERMNAILEELERVLEPDQRAHLEAAVARQRGTPYRRVDVLPFSPDVNMSKLSIEHLRTHLPRYRTGPITRMLLWAAARSSGAEADWATFVLFDGKLVDRLLDLGRRQAHSRADEIRAFFADP